MQKVRCRDVSGLFGWLVISKDRKYFDSGDYALSKAGVTPQSTVGTAIPNPEKWAFCWEVYRHDETLSGSLVYLMPHLVSPLVTRFHPFLPLLLAPSTEKVVFLRWTSSSLRPRPRKGIRRMSKTKWRSLNLRRQKRPPGQQLEESKKSEWRRRKSMTSIRLSNFLFFWFHCVWLVTSIKQNRFNNHLNANHSYSDYCSNSIWLRLAIWPYFRAMLFSSLSDRLWSLIAPGLDVEWVLWLSSRFWCSQVVFSWYLMICVCTTVP